MTLSKGRATNSEDERLAIVVLSHNKREQLLRCLESVGRLRYGPRETVVVDNASSDGSADAVASAYPGVHLLRSLVNHGAAGGRNLGIRWVNDHLEYDHLLFLDDDTVVDEALAGALVAAMRSDPHAGLVTPKAYRMGAGDVIASAGGMKVRLGLGNVIEIGIGERDRGQFAESTTVDSCVGFAVLARRDALNRCGGFDERYNPYGWEEVDLSLRMREAGFTIRYEPGAVCWHAGGTPGRGHRVLVYEQSKIANYYRLMRRHATLAEWCSFLLILPFRAFRLLAGQLVSPIKTTG
jgi:GT2 family glycosyltransferase